VRTHQLEVFCVVYEQRGVTAAARLLRLTQPAVSMQVRDLERELGVDLFERVGRQLQPTPAADALYQYAATIRDTFAEARAAMASYRDGQRGIVRVGASTTGVIYYLPLLLQGFREEHPQAEVTVEADLTERVRDAVLHGRLDIGLIWGPCHDERLIEEPLLQAEFVPIFPPAHPLLATPELAAADLRDQPFILPGDEDSPTRRYIVHWLQAAGVAPRVAMSLRSTEEVKQAVAAGLGVGVVAARGVRFELAAGALATRPVSGLRLPPRPIVLIARPTPGAAGATAAAFARHVHGRADAARTP
jgi:DNA-binding transcriptional LysR family regulator